MLLALVFLGLMRPAGAQSPTLLFSNLNQTPASGLELEYAFVSFTYASKFVTSGTYTQVTSASLTIANPHDADLAFAPQIFSDNGGEPGEMIAAFDGITAIAGTTQLYTTSIQAFSLAPNTSYWFGLRIDSGFEPENFAYWTATATAAVDEGSLYATDPEGVVMDKFSGNEQPWTAAGDAPLNGQFSLSGNVVPEPATWGLLLAGGLAAFALRRRKRAV